MIFQIIFEKITHVATQNNIHPNNIDKNFQIPRINVPEVTTVHSKITPRITRKIANAVPSLKRLSPSNISANFLGAPIDLNIDKTATGSVADIKTQNNKQIIKGISNQTTGNTKNNQNAINIAEIINQNTARELIVFQLLIICL